MTSLHRQHGARNRRSRQRRLAVGAPARGFTLVELIVGVLVTALLMTATTLSLSQAMRSRDASGARMQALARASAAVDRIARDLETAVRDPVVYHTRVLVVDGVRGGAEADELLLFTRSLRRVRPETSPGSGDPPEGGEYEVQYRLAPTPTTAGANAHGGGAPVQAQNILWRRADPTPDEVPDGGGVAAPVEAGIVSLSILAGDGDAWFTSWDSDYSGYPHLVRITVLAADDSGRYTATARRTVALDRTPPPLTASPAAAEDGAATGATSQPTTGGGGR